MICKESCLHVHSVTYHVWNGTTGPTQQGCLQTPFASAVTPLCSQVFPCFLLQKVPGHTTPVLTPLPFPLPGNTSCSCQLHIYINVALTVTFHLEIPTPNSILLPISDLYFITALRCRCYQQLSLCLISPLQHPIICSSKKITAFQEKIPVFVKASTVEICYLQPSLVVPHFHNRCGKFGPLKIQLWSS